MTEQELNQLCDALQTWFQSQELKPSEAVGACENFIAKMILSNPDDLEGKLGRSIDRIRARIALGLMSSK
jgi:hypothetical protein